MSENTIQSAISAALNIAVNENVAEVEITEARITILARIHDNDAGFHRAVMKWRGAINYRQREAGRRAVRGYIPDGLELLWLAVDARRHDQAQPFNPIRLQASQDLAIEPAA